MDKFGIVFLGFVGNFGEWLWERILVGRDDGANFLPLMTEIKSLLSAYKEQINRRPGRLIRAPIVPNLPSVKYLCIFIV